jgi:hypothetical protein
MGAWDAGSFQNDWALDWAGDLSESGDPAAVRTALVRVFEERRPERPSFIGRLMGRRVIEPCLEARIACQGLAAAEIVAFWLGKPDGHFPDYLRNWATRHSAAFSPEFVTLARQAVSSIKTKSELKDLWEEGDETIASKWHAAIADLENRLQTQHTPVEPGLEL